MASRATRRTRRLHSWHLCFPKPKQLTEYHVQARTEEQKRNAGRGTKPAVYHRFISSVSTGCKARLVLRCPRANQFFYVCKPFPSQGCLGQKSDVPQAGRVGAHVRVAGWGRACPYANRTVRLGDNPFSYFRKHRTHAAQTSPQRHKKIKILCKPVEEQSPQLTIGSSAVYQLDEKRSFFLAADKWIVAFLSL